MQSSEFKYIQVTECFDDCIQLLLNRQDKRNAFNLEMILEITSFLKEIRNHPHRALIIKGSGPIFCAGGDIHWMHNVCLQSQTARLAEARRIRNLFLAIHSHDRPTLAAVHGGAFGGGVGLAVACDYVVATKDSMFSTSENKLGIVPACLAPFLVRRVGFVRARQMFLSAEHIDSSKGQMIGLVDRISEEPEDLWESVHQIISSLKVPSPRAQQQTKRLLLDFENLDNDICPVEFLSDSWGSPDGIEGTKAFINKRHPVWEV
jgi:methylglutaconyl-CoA hydratase